MPSPGDLPYTEIKPRSPTLQADSLPTQPQGNPLCNKKLPQIHWTKTIGIYSLPVLKARNSNSKCQQSFIPLEISRRVSFLAFSTYCSSKHFLGLFTHHSNLCLHSHLTFSSTSSRGGVSLCLCLVRTLVIVFRAQRKSHSNLLLSLSLI